MPREEYDKIFIFIIKKYKNFDKNGLQIVFDLCYNVLSVKISSEKSADLNRIKILQKIHNRRYKMGLLDKIKGMVNGNDEPEQEYEAEDMYEENTAIASRQSNRGMSINAASIELKVVRPDSFVNSRQIADHLLNNRTVVLNLEATNKETARRILDFLSGVAYSIGGQLKRVANNTFVITPNNVDVSGDQMRGGASETTVSQAAAQPQAQPAQFTGDTLY